MKEETSMSHIVGENDSCLFGDNGKSTDIYFCLGLKMYVACEWGHSKGTTKMAALRFGEVGYCG